MTYFRMYKINEVIPKKYKIANNNYAKPLLFQNTMSKYLPIYFRRKKKNNKKNGQIFVMVVGKLVYSFFLIKIKKQTENSALCQNTNKIAKASSFHANHVIIKLRKI